jgi:hypothetical protein
MRKDVARDNKKKSSQGGEDEFEDAIFDLDLDLD